MQRKGQQMKRLPVVLHCETAGVGDTFDAEALQERCASSSKNQLDECQCLYGSRENNLFGLPGTNETLLFLK
jgi:hypothetical protein